MNDAPALPLSLSPAPHLHSGATSDRLFFETGVAMTPALIAALAFFGLAFLKTAAGVAAGTVAAALLARRVDPARFGLFDPPALVTALLLALFLPAGLPPLLAALAAFAALTAGRNLFGGTGRNLFNPAMFGVALLAVVFPFHAAETVAPVSPFSAGWFSLASRSLPPSVLPATPALSDLLLAVKPGVPAGACPLIVLLCGAFLLARRTAAWQCVAGTFAGALATAALLPPAHLTLAALLSPLLSGTLLFAAFFCATDPVTMPVRPRMRLLAGFLFGALAVLLRLHTHLPEVVPFALLFVNCLTPLLDSPAHGVCR